MREITLPVDEAYDVLESFDAGIELALAVDSFSVLARLERGAWLIDRRLFPDLPEGPA
ncbi:MAG: hypothetical protein ACSLFP_10805 [Acidimicrobiales bacterium]